MIKHINITQEHIDKGIPGNAYACPIYLAVEEVCKSVKGVFTDYISFWTKDDDQIHRFLSPKAENFIDGFDSNLPVSPFEFDIDIPDNVACS